VEQHDEWLARLAVDEIDIDEIAVGASQRSRRNPTGGLARQVAG
jgi:hypothetical protein